ncbi:ATPase [Phenylobacterium sp.]|uniref:ATPase n=1 Tax=Phenylobacterium sp. TaxID=1871053 RepID=UPI00286CF9B9|nr:ATPase [Phenylobacterium sp.]
MKLPIALLVLALAPTFAVAEVVDQSAVGFEIRRVATIEAPQAKVRAAVLDVGRWWSGGHSYSGDAKNLSIDPVGGCFCEKLADGQVRHMTVVYSDPGALKLFGGLGPLQTTGAAGHLTFKFEKTADPAKTLLTATYDVGGYAKGGLAEVWAKPVDFVLGQQVARLKTYVETGKPD